MLARKILIVDDDPVARQVLHTALRAQHFDTAVAGDALDALTQTRNQKPDLIVLDLGLPAGGGLMFLERLRSIPALSVIPVVIVSGLDRATSEPLAREAGAVAYFEKPAVTDDVIATIRKLLGD